MGLYIIQSFTSTVSPLDFDTTG